MSLAKRRLFFHFIPYSQLSLSLFFFVLALSLSFSLAAAHYIIPSHYFFFCVFFFPAVVQPPPASSMTSNDSKTHPATRSAKSNSYINSSVTSGVTYPTAFAEEVSKKALQAAQVYYDLFFEHTPHPTPEPPTCEIPPHRAAALFRRELHGDGARARSEETQAVSHTPYHTFFPPVLHSSTMQRITRTIVGSPSRPFHAWNWKRSKDFEEILSTHDAFLKKVADRSEGLPSLPGVPEKKMPGGVAKGDTTYAADSNDDQKPGRSLPIPIQQRSASRPIPIRTSARMGQSASVLPIAASAPARTDALKYRSDSTGDPVVGSFSCFPSHHHHNDHHDICYSFPASHQGPEYFQDRSEEGSTRLVIVMVGLPARGKTFLAQKICRLLGWHGELGTVYNLQAAWRRAILKNSSEKVEWVRAGHFERLLQDPRSVERQMYLSVLDEFATTSRKFFEERGKVVILNDDFVSYDLRREVERRFRRLGTQYFYIEMLRDSSQNDLYNQFKVHDAMEYPTQLDREVARKDFEERVRILEDVYEPLDETYNNVLKNSRSNASSLNSSPSSSPLLSTGSGLSARLGSRRATQPPAPAAVSSSLPGAARRRANEKPLSYITIRDSHTVEVHGIRGYLASRIVSYLMNISQRKIQHPIYFVRHGESCYNLEDRIGGNPLLTEQGMRDSAALLEFLDSLKTQLSQEGAEAGASQRAPGGNAGENTIHTWEPTSGAEAKAVAAASSGADVPLPVHPRLEIWTSQLQRAIQTAELSERLLNIKTLRWSSLNEIHAGVCEGLTYAEVREKYSLIDHFRSQNKYSFRYPAGESYQDLVMRLEPVIMELENADKVVVVVAHQAILRCLLAYFGSVSAESSVRVKVPHRVVWRCQYDSKGVARLDEVSLDNFEAGAFASST